MFAVPMVVPTVSAPLVASTSQTLGLSDEKDTVTPVAGEPSRFKATSEATCPPVSVLRSIVSDADIMPPMKRLS
jgi:hypothetical protein